MPGRLLPVFLDHADEPPGLGRVGRRDSLGDPGADACRADTAAACPAFQELQRRGKVDPRQGQRQVVAGVGKGCCSGLFRQSLGFADEVRAAVGLAEVEPAVGDPASWSPPGRRPRSRGLRAARSSSSRRNSGAAVVPRRSNRLKATTTPCPAARSRRGSRGPSAGRPRTGRSPGPRAGPARP